MPTAEIEMDLFKDVASECRKQLQAAGYTAPAGDEDAVSAYLNVQHRRVEPRPRKVHKASYTVPPQLAAGEKLLLDKVARGDDVRPHQSKLLDDATYSDPMLNDFGFQHFHLGTAPDHQNPAYMGRTGELLYAVVRRDDFYAIGVYSHKDWAKLEPLDIVHDEFPDLSSSSTVKGAVGLAFTPTEQDVKVLRANNINTLTMRPDGTIQAPPGGGQTTSGESMWVSMGVNQMRRWVDQTERDLRGTIQPMIDSGELPPKVKVHLDVRGQQTFAVLDQDLGDFNLGGRLWVAPL